MSDSLPFPEEFQLKLAAFILKDAVFARDFSHLLQTSYFDDVEVGSVVGVLQQYRTKYKEHPDRSTLLAYYNVVERDPSKQIKFADRADRVFEEDIKTGLAFARENVRDFVVMAALKETLLAVADDVSEGKVDASMVSRFRDALTIADGVADLGTIFRESYKRVIREEVDPTQTVRIPTGLPHLDATLNGGLKPGELGILLAPPKGFKSGGLLNFGWGANQRGVGANVDYLTLELSEDLQNLRYVFRVSGLGRDEMIADPDKFIRILEKRDKLLLDQRAEFRVKYMAPYACTPGKIREHLDRQLEAGKKLGVLMVDYLDLMGSDSTKEKDYLDKITIVTELRQIGVDYEIPVWTACRATREAIGRRRINMSHMSGTIERVAVADYVYALCHTEEEKLNNRMRIVPVACRNDGGDKIIECKWVPRVMSLRSLEAREMTDDDFDDGSPNRKGNGEGKKKAADALEELVESARKKAKTTLEKGE